MSYVCARLARLDLSPLIVTLHTTYMHATPATFSTFAALNTFAKFCTFDTIDTSAKFSTFATLNTLVIAVVTLATVVLDFATLYNLHDRLC